AAQDAHAVAAVHDVPAHMVSAQLEAVCGDLDVAAVKVGMVSVPETISAIANGIASFTQPIVLDPVMVAKSGDRLLSEAAISTLREKLIPLDRKSTRLNS